MPQIAADIPAHDEVLVGDQLSTLVVNYRWRKIIAPLLARLCLDSFWTGTQAEIEDATYKAKALICDFYDCGVSGGATMNYIGALVARTTTHNFGTGTILVAFDDDVTFPAHDTDNFWDAGAPETLIVPIGKAGYYHVYAEARLDATGSDVVFLELMVNVTVVSSVRWRQDKQQKPRTAVAVELADGDFVSVVLRTFAGTRNAVAVSVGAAAVRCGLYRIGIAP